MDFGVTSEGFKAKRFTDILAELGNSLKTELNIDIDSDPDSVAKVLTNIYALALAEGWALPQTLQSMFDIDKAEGKHLDDLVGYLGMSRLKAAASSGNVYITANKEVVVGAPSTFKDNNNNEYTNSGAINVTKGNLVSLTLSFSGNVNVGNKLTLNINGITSTVTITTTLDAAITLLVDDVNNKSNKMTASKVGTGINALLTLVNEDDKISSTVSTTSNMIVNSITSFGNVAKTINGAFEVSTGVVTTSPAISGITSVTNRYEFAIGRLRESDIDLRNRHSLSLSTAGAGTVEAIRADILRVEGVTNVIVLENDTLSLDTENLVPKSFLCVVKGGTEAAIGESIWLSKGAGIATNGDIIVPVLDSNAVTQYVNFSRPDPIYIHVHVDYSKYSEQSGEFPDDGEQKMLSQILAYGNDLSVGEDVIPQRFATQIFNSVGGLAVVNVSVGSTVGEHDPTPTLSGNLLPIGTVSESNFDELRITFTEV